MYIYIYVYIHIISQMLYFVHLLYIHLGMLFFFLGGGLELSGGKGGQSNLIANLII